MNYGHGEQTFAKVNTESTTAVIHYSNFYMIQKIYIAQLNIHIKPFFFMLYLVQSFKLCNFE